MDPLRQHHPPASLRFIRQGVLSAVAAGLLSFLGAAPVSPNGAASPYASWEKTLTPDPRTPFPSIEPFHASYRFGWEGIPAGGAVVEIGRGSAPDSLRITARGGPNKLIRKLWNYRALYVGEAGIDGRVPSWFRMDEEVARGDLISEATFTDNLAVSCHRFVWESKPWKVTPLPGIRDLFAAMLFVRSQPLALGDSLRLTVFPDQNPYLVDLKVAGRDVLSIQGKRIPAVRFTIGIRTIATQGPEIGKLAPHKKFHSGRVWMSDDPRRLPLRAEVDVFIGSVFAEISSMDPKL